jgi:protein-S-isoprenylcysteine O-methyltransferase Ste14
VSVRNALQRAIRPSETRSLGAIWAKSLLNAALFFAVFVAALPWLAHRLLPVVLPIPGSLRSAGAAALFGIGVALWLACLDAFSRHGRGTPLPLDAPRNLVTRGPFAFVRNPIMLAELLVISAVALHFASLGIAVYGALLALGAHVSVLYVEEPELRGRFGEGYEEYCRAVPRWLPRARKARGLEAPAA